MIHILTKSEGDDSWTSISIEGVFEGPPDADIVKILTKFWTQKQKEWTKIRPKGSRRQVKITLKESYKHLESVGLKKIEYMEHSL